MSEQPDQPTRRRVRVHHDDVCDPPHPVLPPVLLASLRRAYAARRS